MTHSGPVSSEPSTAPLKTIMSQIQVGDWFVTVDLKDAYFHMQVVWRHRKFFRLTFGGKAYQYKVLPFGLALASRTFTKCMDAALAPLRLQGIRVLNYLNDCLIPAYSRELESYHRDIVLHHIWPQNLASEQTPKRVFSPLLDKQGFWGFIWIPFKCRPFRLLPRFPVSTHVWPASS